MEDSVKGMLVTFAIISVFIISLVNFIILFPIEQGYTFTTIDNNTYLIANNISSSSTILNISSIENTINSGFEEWDIEVGYMGSNTQKSSRSSLNSYFTNVMNTLTVMAKEVFTTTDGSIHPVIIVLGMFTTLGLIYATIVFVKWLRTGY
jgi:hypothetical protein